MAERTTAPAWTVETEDPQPKQQNVQQNVQQKIWARDQVGYLKEPDRWE
jgi:hypothetical protein